jgi:glutaredoxin-related protein
MIKIYGSMLCPDCVQCRQDLDKAGVAYEYLDFADDLRNLKDFLTIRDGSDMFSDVRCEGRIGIPCIVKENGSITLDWTQFLM